MKLELNDLLQGISSWKNLLKQKDEKTENLQGQLLQALKRNEVLESTCANLFSEVSELNNAVSSLRSSLLKIEHYEVDRKILLEEKQSLKNTLESLEKLYHDQTKDTKQELEKMKLIHKEETTELVSQLNNEACKNVQMLQNELDKKDNQIKELQSIITRLQMEKDEDALKIKIQYEKKIGKLKQQIPKSKMQIVHGMQMHDIFRQKYITLKKESEEKISKLNEQVNSLQMAIESLKPGHESSSLNSVLLTSSKQDAEAPPVICKPVVNSSLLRYLEDEISIQDDDFAVKKQNLSRTKSMQPQKKKLFNLNHNYFVH